MYVIGCGVEEKLINTTMRIIKQQAHTLFGIIYVWMWVCMFSYFHIKYVQFLCNRFRCNLRKNWWFYFFIYLKFALDFEMIFIHYLYTGICYHTACTLFAYDTLTTANDEETMSLDFLWILKLMLHISLQFGRYFFVTTFTFIYVTIERLQLSLNG